MYNNESKFLFVTLGNSNISPPGHGDTGRNPSWACPAVGFIPAEQGVSQCTDETWVTLPPGTPFLSGPAEPFPGPSILWHHSGCQSLLLRAKLLTWCWVGAVCSALMRILNRKASTWLGRWIRISGDYYSVPILQMKHFFCIKSPRLSIFVNWHIGNLTSQMESCSKHCWILAFLFKQLNYEKYSCIPWHILVTFYYKLFIYYCSLFLALSPLLVTSSLKL